MSQNENKLGNSLSILIEQYKTFNVDYKNKAQELFKSVVKGFFVLNPTINSIIWTQYAPYFNDGEECVFNVHEPSFSNAIDPDDIADVYPGDCYEGDKEDIFAITSYDLPKDGIDTESIKFMENIIQNVEMYDVMKTMFGPHSKVVATREGFDVSEYDHE